jgi:hypothetical protein
VAGSVVSAGQSTCQHKRASVCAAEQTVAQVCLRFREVLLCEAFLAKPFKTDLRLG